MRHIWEKIRRLRGGVRVGTAFDAIVRGQGVLLGVLKQKEESV